MLETNKLPKAEVTQNPFVILVVDDVIDSLKMLGDALGMEGYTVMLARDAEEALERFEHVVPDGVLLDAIMPGINGFELCRRIKNTAAWSHVPIVFMTGLSETEQILEGFSAGGVDYVVKPLRIPEVLVRLSTHVRNAQAARLARQAMDIGGMGAVMLDTQGRMAWRSPQATAWLTEAFGEQDLAARKWLAAVVEQKGEPVAMPQNRVLRGLHLGRSGLTESMLLLRVESSSIAEQRQLDVPLTPRETEVLSWVAKGKTNRDIAEILGMSPRTVNKHLEHIFEKLGVETRSAATALATRVLNAG